MLFKPTKNWWKVATIVLIILIIAMVFYQGKQIEMRRKNIKAICYKQIEDIQKANKERGLNLSIDDAFYVDLFKKQIRLCNELLK